MEVGKIYSRNQAGQWDLLYTIPLGMEAFWQPELYVLMVAQVTQQQHWDHKEKAPVLRVALPKHMHCTFRMSWDNGEWNPNISFN